MRQQPRLPLSGFGEVLLQHRGDTDVELSPPAAQQRLVGGVLKQRMPEHIDGVRWLTAMVKKLGLHEPFQRLSQALLGKRIGNRTHRLIKNSRTSAAPVCATSFAGPRRSSRAVNNPCSVSGTASGGSGPRSKYSSSTSLSRPLSRTALTSSSTTAARHPND